MSIKKDIIWRTSILYFFIVILGMTIISRIVYLQVFEGEELRAKAKKQANRFEKALANRGDICAQDGRLLASSIPYYQLRMDFRAAGLTDELFKNNVDSLAICLSSFFKDKSVREYKNILRNSRRRHLRYVLLNRKKVNFTQLKFIKKFPLFRLGQNSGGLICIQENERIQPHKGLASRTIGSLIKGREGELIGNVGIEGAYESYLKGKDGVNVLQKMSERWVPVRQTEAIDGMDVITTIDVDYQDVAQVALLNQLRKYKADHGCVVLMEVSTGDIKAIANLGFDKRVGRYRERFNYAVGEATEPGSTFKLASIMALLEDSYVKLSDTVRTGNGKKLYYDRWMRDSHKGGYGDISVKEVFEKSSNVGISTLIFDNYKTKPSNFINRLYSFHLHEPLGLEIKGEGKPMIKFPDDPTWSGISLPWMSMGYEIKQTPLQTLTFYNSIANNGEMVKPRFVKGLQSRGKYVKKFDIQVIESSICSDETLSQVQELLLGVVENGTAKNLKNKNYKIAGKTGTARIADRNKGYGVRVYQASFVGYFPADNPKYSCVVVINSPDISLGFYGNQVAGPVFKTIADRVFAKGYNLFDSDKNKHHKKVKVPISLNGNKDDLTSVFKTLGIDIKNEYIDSKWVISSRKDSIIEYKERILNKYLVPNVKGMGLKDAIFILENAGLRVSVARLGIGSVNKQSLRPGSNFRKGDKIRIELI